jgi:MurNAc alpha-1-phosphate uridylyltransferase
LGSDPFLVINGDIWCDWQPEPALGLAAQLNGDTARAWLLLAANPPHHPEGDFHLDTEGRVTPATGDRLTFSGIGVYHPALFEHIVRGTRAPLGPLLRQEIAQGSVRGARHAGDWVDVGTPQRLAELDAALSASR